MAYLKNTKIISMDPNNPKTKGNMNISQKKKKSLDCGSISRSGE
jgi:hypothetical protein